MTLEAFGHRGHGKGRIGASLALYFKFKLGCEIYTTDQKMIAMGLAKRETRKTLFEGRNCVHYLPELWRNIDSRDYKNNVFITEWWQLQRHQDIVIIYDTQLRGQMDLRIRETNDYSVECRKIQKEEGDYFKYIFYDPYDWSVLTTLYVKNEDLKFIDDYYDSTGELLKIE